MRAQQVMPKLSQACYPKFQKKNQKSGRQPRAGSKQVTNLPIRHKLGVRANTRAWQNKHETYNDLTEAQTEWGIVG